MDWIELLIEYPWLLLVVVVLGLVYLYYRLPTYRSMHDEIDSLRDLTNLGSDRDDEVD